MKKIAILVFISVVALSTSAQHQINSFFDALGGVRAETAELNQAADTIENVFHRYDDIVWARVVYRMIDLRYKKNYQMYFPSNAADPQYKSLFRLTLDAITDGLPVYRKGQDDLKPSFNNRMESDEVARTLITKSPLDDTMDWDIATSSDFLLNYDSINRRLTFNDYAYEGYVRNQVKFIAQEVIFFNKHTSRLHTKIIAIAPLYAENVNSVNDNLVKYIWDSMLFWVSFDQLRPYLVKQKMIPDGNDQSSLTYDEFFIKRLFSSYILGESNMYGRMLLKYATTEEEAKKEQDRIELELLNFEQDLWEY